MNAPISITCIDNPIKSTRRGNFKYNFSFQIELGNFSFQNNQTEIEKGSLIPPPLVKKSTAKIRSITKQTAYQPFRVKI